MERDSRVRAGVKGRGLLLPLIVMMIGLAEVNVTRTSKRIKAKARRKGRKGGEWVSVPVLLFEIFRRRIRQES